MLAQISIAESEKKAGELGACEWDKLMGDQRYYILEGMLEKSQSWHRTQQLRKDIRRMELDSYFQERRQELLNYIETSGFSLTFLNAQDQDSFLEEATRELTGEPKEEWLSTILRLRKSVIAFKGDFDSWFKTTIVRSLLSSLKVGQNVKVAEETLKLLIDVLYSSSGEGNGSFSRRFMEYEPVSDLLTLASNKMHCLYFRLLCTMVLSKMVGENKEYRDSFLHNGAGSVLAEQGRELAMLIQAGEMPAQNLTIYLPAVFNFMKIQKPTTLTFSLKNTILALVQPMMGLLMHNLADKYLRYCLDIFNNFLNISNAQIFSTIYYWNGFPTRIIQLLTAEQPLLRAKAAYIIAIITCNTHPPYCQDLMSRGILDHYWEACLRFTSPKQDYLRQMLGAIGNLADSSSHCEIIASHQIMEIVVSHLSSELTDLQYQATFALGNIVQRLSYCSLFRLVTKYQLLKPLALGLLNSPLDPRVAIEIIDTLRKMVKRSMEVIHVGENPIVDSLERYYHISKFVQNVVNTASNKNLVQASQQLFNELNSLSLENNNST